MKVINELTSTQIYSITYTAQRIYKTERKVSETSLECNGLQNVYIFVIPNTKNTNKCMHTLIK